MEPFFLDINSRKLFCLRFDAQVRPARLRVLIAPPFGEELNKCRKVLAMTCRQLAAAGCDVLLADLYGTGDSSGNLREAGWQDWIDDWIALDRWWTAASAGSPPAYLAVRSGTLLLAGAHSALNEFHTASIVLWQPVQQGARFLQQFLRLRVMSQRLAGGTESVKDLERELAETGFMEVAGYELSSKLATGLAATTLEPGDLARAARVGIIEFSPGPNAQPGVPAAKLVEELRRHGVDCQAAVVDCEQFWATQEIAAPAIVVDTSVDMLMAGLQ